ncbi:MAG: sugar phosphorylase [Spirochaetaceae bacterium]|jgi:sucrose phosphorylase|nr:sugar phosphorylase [Spirochaetaceae bacterium]
MNTIKARLDLLYPGKADAVFAAITALVEKWKAVPVKKYPSLSEKDVALITYGDSLHNDKKGEALKTLNRFLTERLHGCVNIVHILPMFPYTSDDGFSVSDYRTVNKNLGEWSDIDALSKNFDLVLDAVINHCSVSSAYFKGFLSGDEKYRDFFIDCDPNADYTQVIRPRTHPLLTPFTTQDGVVRHVWTTFSEDQVDFNYANPAVLLEALDILLLYTTRGARFIRLDAIGFIWKKLGTSCMHLRETHEIIKIMRSVLNAISPNCALITETNVAHKDNIAYFGNGKDEASLVYQFPLPPLVLYSFIAGNAEKLTHWAANLDQCEKGTAYFNFLASHDGIGVRPVEGILNDREKKLMVDTVIRRGGKISYRSLPGGIQEPYELNISYIDALSDNDEDDAIRLKRFAAAHVLLLSLSGLPAIYYNSILGTRNDLHGAETSGINRRINRKKFSYTEIEKALNDGGSLPSKTFFTLKALIEKRVRCPHFAPDASQKVLAIDPRVFVLKRKAEEEKGCVYALINVSGESCALTLPGGIRERLDPFEAKWLFRDLESAPFDE